MRLLVVVAGTIAILGGAALVFLGEGDDGEAQAVRSLVTIFGQQLNRVSLLAPEDEARQQIREAYSPLVSDALLAAWLAHPSAAPGRLTSSPWPDRIEITQVSEAEATYLVEGTIVLMTSVEAASPEDDDAGRRPVTLTVSNVGGEWVITAVRHETRKPT